MSTREGFAWKPLDIVNVIAEVLHCNHVIRNTLRLAVVRDIGNALQLHAHMHHYIVHEQVATAVQVNCKEAFLPYGTSIWNAQFSSRNAQFSSLQGKMLHVSCRATTEPWALYSQH